MSENICLFPSACPLNISQLGVYMECVGDAASVKYNIPVILHLPKGTDADRFARAAQAVTRAHPSFFVVFGAPDGVPAMLPREFDVRVDELRADSLADGMRAFVKPFDLKNGPLFRFAILRAPDGDAFALDVHHLIFDGTSLNLFVKQLAEAYTTGKVSKEAYTLYDANLDLAAPRSEETLNAFRELFRETLDGVDCDSKPVPDVIDPNAPEGTACLRVPLDGRLRASDAEAYARARGLSENALFTAAFGYALAKMNGTTESYFAAAHTGRSHPKLADTYGMFVRTLPMTCRFSESMAPHELIRRVYDDYYRVKKNDCVPFGELAARYGANTDVTFIYQSELFRDVSVGHGSIRVELYEPDVPVSALEIMVMKRDGGYQVTAHYAEGRYTEAFVRGFVRMFAGVVRGMISRERLADISLADDEARAMIDAFNRTEKDYDAESTVVDLFRRQAARTPDAECLVFEEKRFTYRQVDEITQRLAKRLRAIGVGRGKIAGVLIPRCEYMLIASMGVLKAGGAYLPLDPSYPPERLNLMLSDSGAMALITTEELSPIISADFAGERLFVSQIPALPDPPADLPAPTKDDLFVMLYTSGSTGTPKGVMFAHSNTMVTAAWERDFYALGPGANVTAYASYGFDANVFDTYATITSGATLHIISDEIRLDLLALQRYFNENRVTHSTMTTQVGRQFALLEGTTTLKHLSVAGEKLTPLAPPRGMRLYNLYGPTEGSILATGFTVDRLYRDIPIGRAIDNVKIYVVDPCGRLLPPGASGELWISGAHVTQGYRNRPDKTREAYGENPFCGDAGYERVYRTGDIVRYMSDGCLQFIGRRDGQVKVRGFRVELTEVEEVVRRFPGIRDATVAAFDDPAGGKFIAAYVVSDSPVDADALSDFIRAEKPPYMVPAVVTQIDRIPLNQNQKVNRRALPRPERKAVNARKPETETQQRIFDIVADVVGHREFGIDTNLFDAGLTSVATLRLNVRLSEEFDRNMSLASLKEHDTVRKLEGCLTAGQTAKTYDPREDYPITQTQRGIFVECGANADGVAYNMPLLMRLSPRVDLDRLETAVAAALDAHPYAKATLFADDEGNVRARRNDGAPSAVARVACAALPPKDELVRPFTLLGGPLYRAELYETGDGNYLFMDFHHILSDGASEAILLADIDRAYAGNAPAKEVYTGFEAALDEEAARNTDRLSQAKAYYDGVFSGCDTECLPPKSPEGTGAGTVRRACALNASELRAYLEKRRLTANAFFLAAFGVTLSRFGLFDDAVFATVYNGRSDARLASSLAMLVKTLPVLVRTGEDRPVSELIRDTQNQLMESMANDLYSFAEISRAYGIRSDVLFVYQGDEFAFDSLCGEPAQSVPVMPTVAKSPIAVTVSLVAGAYELSADYRKDLFCAPLMDALLSAFEQTLVGFVREERVSALSLLSPEAETRLSEINHTKGDFERLPAHVFFERYAASQPGKTAVISNGESLTFDELNRLANRVAHALRRAGVKENAIVGMLLDRTVRIPAAEIGIWKAGGAFLGLLPSYPDERIEFCLTDAESPVVITTGDILAKRPALFAGDRPYRALLFEELIREENDKDPDLPIDADSLCYSIYTSGSTGRPKGVLIAHRNLANCAQAKNSPYAHLYGHADGAVNLALASVTFDMMVFDILLPLMNGNTVAIATEAEIHNPAQLAALMRKTGVTRVAATPSLMNNFISIPEIRPAIRELDAVVLGAESFPGALYNELRALNPGLRIINGYGPTECTITCCCKELKSDRGITIGSPLMNTAFYVTDKFGNVLPPFACGELIICGELVGRGYVKLPEKTRASFFTLRGLPAYHSGDTVRLNAQGEVEFFGRIDNQVKLRGFRVELDEIENVICSFPGVKQSKVVVRNQGAGDFLAGYFTADAPVDKDALTRHLKAKLAYYMVPDVLGQLDRMPLTPSGKIDKKALPELRREKREGGRRAPKKSLEERLCELFRDVLSADSFYADDSFFEMGGTSLTASKVTMRLMSQGFKVEYQDIFDHPTPESLAGYLESRKAPEPAGAPAGEEKDENAWISALLQNNTLSRAAETRREPLGDVLLTGAVGFLGIHVLRELLDRDEGRVVCLLRRGDSPTSEERLRSMLMYYFGSLFRGELERRVTVIDADIADEDLSRALDGVRFDTVINCAACVKHYAADDQIERINVRGVENLIRAARSRGARMIQISTTSVPGVHTEETYRRQLKMHEHELFVVDSMDNKYCISKYRAELKMLEAIRDGMRGKIIRVGNLMGRHSDGEFQINFNTNAFLNALRGFATIGKCPISHATDPMSFSPIDLTARAIVLLAGTNDMFTAFHADNRFGFDEMQLIEACNRCGIAIAPVDDREYYADYYRMLGDERVNARLQGLVTNDRPDLHMVDTDNAFTANVLYRLGFSWPLTDSAYLERAISSLMTLDYFEPDTADEY